MLDLCTLGTGGTMPLPDRALSSLYVRVNGRSLLIDCGEGTQVGVQKLGWGMQCIDGILISHYHADHVSGLPGMLLALTKAMRTEPLHIYGPAGLPYIVGGLRVIAPQLTFPVILHELKDDLSPFSLIGLTITPSRWITACPAWAGGCTCPARRPSTRQRRGRRACPSPCGSACKRARPSPRRASPGARRT